MDLKLKDKVAIVTGAGSQIGYGRAIAHTLAREGCHIVVTDIDADGAGKTGEQVNQIGVQSLVKTADVTDRSQVDQMVAAALDRFGRIDILVNNAGASGPQKPFLEMTRQDWDLDIQVNLYGQMNVAQSVLPAMVEHKYGRIINFSGGRGIPNLAIYGAAKAGIIAFTQALAKEVAPMGIVVNALGPGLGVTGLVIDTASEQFLEMNRQRSALKRLCTPEDVGPAVAFLASDVCSYMVGQFIQLSTF